MNHGTVTYAAPLGDLERLLLPMELTQGPCRRVPTARDPVGRPVSAGAPRAARAETPQPVPRAAGVSGVRGRSPVRSRTDLAARRDAVDVVDDGRERSVTSADVAEHVTDLGHRTDRDARGVLHATSSGETTRYAPADGVLRHLGAGPDRMRPAGGGALAGPAPRPAHRALARDRGQYPYPPPPRDRRSALHQALPGSARSPLRETP